MDRFRNILVGVDLSDGDLCLSHELSPPTRAAVNKAIWLAEHTGARVTFLTSLLPCLGDLRETRSLAEMERLQIVVDEIHERARTRMAGLVAEARSHGIEADEIRTDGTAWLKLIETVVTKGHDLVLVGSHRQHTLGRLLLGSTGRRLIRKCPCPVWVTSPRERGSDPYDPGSDRLLRDCRPCCADCPVARRKMRGGAASAARRAGGP